MKKNMIALAVAAAVAAPVANAAPTVYGIANMAVQNNAGGDKTGVSIDSVASRVGVKGSEDLGGGLKAVYKMEFGVTMRGDKAADGENKANLTARNQYVGLAGGFGTVILGRHDTPVKMSQPKDLFNDGLGDNTNTTSIGWKGGENRLNNVLAYVSPSFGGVKLVGALVPAQTGTDDSSIANAISVAAMYGSTKKGLYLAAAYEATDKYALGATEDKYTRISAQYAVAGLVANAMYQIHDDGTNNNNNIMLSAGYKMGKFMPKLKYSLDGGDAKGSYIGAGVNYSLGKKTTAYLELNNFDDDMAGKGYMATSIGLQHKF